jgi:broad specificity phosphatase PhoE
MAILLIRHGETLGNRNRIIQVAETPLSDRGLEQAGRLGQRLSSAPIKEIWTSHLSRARMTAEAVERTTGAPLREVEDLEERNLGALRGTAYADLDFNPFMPGYAPPEGETWEVFYDRVDRTWEMIERHWVDQFSKASSDAHFAVVSHGLFLRVLIERILLSPEQLATHGDENGEIVIANTALTVVAPGAPGEAASEHRVELIACTAHLDDETAHDVNSIVGI